MSPDLLPPAREEALTPAVARWLVGEGLAAISKACAHLDAGGDDLHVVVQLRDRGLAPERARAALDAARARRRARDQWPRSEDLVFTSSALEQASDPRVSSHRAKRFSPYEAVLDLCCGAGGDALNLAAASRVLAVDLDPARVLLCRHNANAHDADLHAVVGDALAPPADTALPVHVDPGRRRDGRRVRWLRDHVPPVGGVAAMISERPGGAIVLSPAVALTDPDLPPGELEFIQVGRDLVEACLWLGDLGTPDALASATLLDAEGGLVDQRTRVGPSADIAVAPVGAWLLEPTPALVRARLHHDHGLALDGWRVARDRALLSTDVQPAASPWHTAWEVEAVLPGRPKAVAAALRSLPAAPLAISLHGDDRPVELWWKALRQQPRGPQGRRLHVIAADGAAIAVLARPSS